MGAGPNLSQEPDSFFQSDKDVELSVARRHKQAVLGTIGSPITLASKILNFEFFNTYTCYTAQAGFIVQKVDVKTGKVIARFGGHTGPITSIAIEIVDGIDKFILTSSWDKTIKKFDTRTQSVIYTCKGHKDFVKCVRISGHRIFSASADKTIGVWDLETGHLLSQLQAHTRSVEDLAISPDGLIMFSCSSDSIIKRWDLTKLEIIQVFEGHLTSIYRMFVDWENETLWSVSGDKTAIRWDVQTGKIDTTLPHPDFVKSVTLSSSGHLITGCRDENIRIYDPATEKLVAKISAHYDEVSCIYADGLDFWTGSLDCTIRRWNIHDVLSEYCDFEADIEEVIENLMTDEEERELAELMGL